MMEGVQSCSSGRKGKQHLRNPSFSPISFFSLSLSPLSVPHSFSGVGKEVRRGRQIVQKDVGVSKRLPGIELVVEVVSGTAPIYTRAYRMVAKQIAEVVHPHGEPLVHTRGEPL
jgi:hypothetical protein